ncbi:MAG: type II toxin-antitoxin system HicA family toxin [Candidatus Sumerlaeaceae bacterium]
MEARKAFERAGWVYVRTGSSRHMVLRKAGQPQTLSIPEHRTLDRGLLRSLIRDAGLTVEEFTTLLQ